jgi:hypothetical protein
VATRPSSEGGRSSEARLGVEATPCPQTDEDLARRTPLQPLLHLDGIVAGVEDEQGSGPLLGRPAQKRFHLLGGHLVSIPRGAETRSTSTGAVQLSRTKLSLAMNW